MTLLPVFGNCLFTRGIAVAILLLVQDVFLAAERAVSLLLLVSLFLVLVLATVTCRVLVS